MSNLIAKDGEYKFDPNTDEKCVVYPQLPSNRCPFLNREFVPAGTQIKRWGEEFGNYTSATCHGPNCSGDKRVIKVN